MKIRNFRALLTARQKEIDSLVCVGLDPLIEKAPKHLLGGLTHPELGPSTLYLWMKMVVDATAPYACMFKPQIAHWEAIKGGVEILRQLIEHIHHFHPDIPVFVDCKRGDIDRTQTQYAHAILGYLKADGMNYCGYMGKDTLKALAKPEYAGRALVGLGRTSNPDAWEVQDERLVSGEQSDPHAPAWRVWMDMVNKQMRWSKEIGVLADAGIVMGAAHKDLFDPSKIRADHLVTARKIVGNDMWFLIPGIGTQGGFVEATVQACFAGPGTIAINSSSGIIFASDGDDFDKAAHLAAAKLRDEIIAAGGSCRAAV